MDDWGSSMVDGRRDVSVRAYLGQFGRSDRAKIYLPVGVLALVGLVVKIGLVVTLLCVGGFFLVALPVGYVL